MYSSIHRSNGTFFVRMRSTGVAATIGFKHGRVTFDPIAKTVQFSRHNPLPLPDFVDTVKNGAILSFGLLAPDGTVRPQRREVLIIEGKDGQLFAPAIQRNPSKKSSEDGWRIRTLKFRAFFTHPGTDIGDVTGHNVEYPQWLRDSINRQWRFRNRLVKLCLDARNACRPVNYEDLTRFIKETVLPAVDGLNNSLGHSKDKISAKKLRVDTPSIFFLTRFGAYLQYLEKNGKPVPAGLAQQITDFAKDLKIDFAPIRLFKRNLDAIVRQERYLEDLSLVERKDEDGEIRVEKVFRRLTDPDEIEARRSELKVRDWEWKPVAMGFKAILKRRKTQGLRFHEGWPRFSDESSTNWGIHYNLNAGADASLLNWRGIRALNLEPGIPPDLTGRNWKPGGRRARRTLNPAQISFHDSLADEQFIFRFVVLRHQFPIPEGALIKGWKLIHNRTGLWLCFVVEAKFAQPLITSGETGAVHIGWRKEGAELWPAMVFNPTCAGGDAFHRIVIDTELPPEKSDEHTPFRINMGASRKGRRSPYWISRSKPHLRVDPGAKGAVQIQDTWDGIEWLGKWRSDRKDMFKSLLLNSLDPVPAGLQNAGERTLHNLGPSLTDPVLARAFDVWAAEDKEIAGLIAEFSTRVASRLSDGYSRVAHDICRLFSKHGVSTIATQDSILLKISKKTKPLHNEKETAMLESSQTNRHRIAPGKLLLRVSSVAEKYGLNIAKVGSTHISRAHKREGPECNHVNPRSAERVIHCEKCGVAFDQDENACRNMVAKATPSETAGSARNPHAGS